MAGEAPATREDLVRLETKLDQLGVAVNRLILIEDRQTNQAVAMEGLKTLIATVDSRLQSEIEDLRVKVEAQINALRLEVEITRRKVDTWVQRGIGAWAVVVTVWALYTQLAPK